MAWYILGCSLIALSTRSITSKGSGLAGFKGFLDNRDNNSVNGERYDKQTLLSIGQKEFIGP